MALARIPFEGAFDYAGGYPGVSAVPALVSQRVQVLPDGLRSFYYHWLVVKPCQLIDIPSGAIRGVALVRDTVIVEVQVEGEVFPVRFTAARTGAEREAQRLYSALRFLGDAPAPAQPGEPSPAPGSGQSHPPKGRGRTSGPGA